MRSITYLFTLLVLVGTLSCKQQQKEAEPEARSIELPTEKQEKNLIAEAVLEAKSGSGVVGKVRFTTIDGGVMMLAEIEGATPGEHAIHIHDIGDCSSEDGKSAGGHWNPTGEAHGKWGDDEHHSGDIGNLEVKENGSGMMVHNSKIWSIGGDEKTNIIGRSVIIHVGVDDFTTQPTGDAGGRIACGVIEMVEE